MRRLSVALSSLAALFTCNSARAIITISNTDHSTAPTGTLANSGWQYQASFTGVDGDPSSPTFGDIFTYAATAIGPHSFITAGHLGGLIGQSAFTYDGVAYPVTTFGGLPNRDLAVVTVGGNQLPSWAPIWNPTLDGSLVGKTITMFGRGTQKGAEVDSQTDSTGTGSKARGWLWGDWDNFDPATKTYANKLRWGTNVVTRLTDRSAFGDASTPASSQEYLEYSFDANGLPDEGIISDKDSGGGNFAQSSSGTWKLAAVNSVVGAFTFSTSPSGASPSSRAAIYNFRDLYLQSGATWFQAQQFSNFSSFSPQRGWPANVSDVPLSQLAPYIQAGDANLDGKVDTADFMLVASHFNKTGQTWITGDFNSDGVVNSLDFNAVASNFGLVYTSTASASPLGATLVPEPAVALPLVLSGLAFARRFRRR